MTTIKLDNEQTSLFFNISKNDEDYSISDIIKLLRYSADCLEKGNVIYDGNYIYTKSFKKGSRQ